MILAVIPLDKIQVPENRLNSQLDPEQMDGLIESINRLGLINPISVKEQDSQYILISGMNRLLALNALGKKTAPAFVYTVPETPIDLINISENLHRGQTNPLDEAEAIMAIHTRMQCSIDDTAKILGRSENWVKGRLELLSLPDDLQTYLKAKHLTMGVCQQLAYVQDTNLRRQIAVRAIDYSASAKMVKGWVDALTSHPISTHLSSKDHIPISLALTPPELTLICLNCRISQPPYQFTSELICADCKTKISSHSGAGPSTGNPGPEQVNNS